MRKKEYIAIERCAICKYEDGLHKFACGIVENNGIKYPLLSCPKCGNKNQDGFHWGTRHQKRNNIQMDKLK